VSPETLGYLLFTSGTSGAPKACLCSQGRLARIGAIVAQMYALTPDDVCYLAMPLFHSNALMAGWGPALMACSTFALPASGRFSASGFLPDVRAAGATYFNYVGKPLSYILATPEQPDDADNPLVRAFGNEGSVDDVARFAERFAVAVTDSYGSTEGGATVARTPDTPPGALGRAPEGTVVLDPTTGEECPPARFDDRGRLLNAEEAIGELVSKVGGAGFEGYWRNDDAERARLREGWYWTGDLAYRDAAGFFYFAGRDDDWLRVDGENFASAPIERILQRHPDVVLAAVYAVPDPTVGDQVMAALQLRPGVEMLDPRGLADFLAAHGDLGTKWAPRFVRLSAALPTTATNKVLKRSLRAERWNCADTVLWKRARGAPYEPLGAEDAAALEEAAGDRPL
jgi:fatty-acyl-CoA synthase